jgi:hypothetical protein
MVLTARYAAAPGRLNAAKKVSGEMMLSVRFSVMDS